MALSKDFVLAASLAGALGLAAVVSNLEQRPASPAAPAATPKQAQNAQPTLAPITAEDIPYTPSEYRDDLAAMLTLLQSQHPSCMKEMNLGTARLADSVDPDSVNPEFLVHCDKERQVVRFTWMDMVNRRLPAPAPKADYSAAVAACEQVARVRATHPQTVKFSRVMDMQYRDNGDGSATIRTAFKARNAFNLETKFRIRCEYDEGRIVDASVGEYF